MNILSKSRIFTSNKAFMLSPKYEVTNVFGDGLIASVPAGHMLDSVIISETNGGAVIINIGTVALSNDVVASASITAGSLTTINVGETYSLTADQDIFISDNGLGWGTAKLNIIFIFKQV